MNAPMDTYTPYYKSLLLRELARRIEKNPRYSLRAFARAVQVDPGNFSRFLAGKAFLSSSKVNNLLTHLNLNPEEKDLFLRSIMDEQNKRKLLEPNLRFYKSKIQDRITSSLDVDLFNVIGNWYYPAILELTFVDNFDSSPKWIAKQLDISEAEAASAVDRLLGLKLLKYKDGRLVKTDNAITNTKDRQVTTSALRRLQKQILEKAIVALEEVPIEDRNQVSMTMAIDPEKIPMAKQIIGDFVNQLCAAISNGPNRRVYQLSTSFYPLQKKEKS